MLLFLSSLGRSVSEADEAGDGPAAASSAVHSSETDDSERVIFYLRRRISELVDNLNAAESKATLFHAECNRLKSRLQLNVEEKATMEATQRELSETCRALRDELATTVRAAAPRNTH